MNAFFLRQTCSFLRLSQLFEDAPIKSLKTHLKELSFSSILLYCQVLCILLVTTICYQTQTLWLKHDWLVNGKLSDLYYVFLCVKRCEWISKLINTDDCNNNLQIVLLRNKKLEKKPLYSFFFMRKVLSFCTCRNLKHHSTGTSMPKQATFSWPRQPMVHQIQNTPKPLY